MVQGLVVFSSQLLRVALLDAALATLVAGGVWLVSRAIRRRWPAFDHALWMLVLIRLVLPPDLAHPLAVGAALDRLGLGMGGLWASAAEPVASWDATMGSPVASSTATRTASLTASTAASVLALLLWACIVVALVVRDRSRARGYRQVLRRAVVVSTGPAARLTERWRRRLGIRRRVRVLSADAPLAPFTTGLLRPVIFVPRALLEPENRHALRAALGHELAHVARWDVGLIRLERWVTRLYFFHPVVWLASRRLHSGRERLCDAMAVSRGLVSGPRFVRGLLDALQLDLQGVEAPSMTVSQRRILMRSHAVLAVRPTSRTRPLLAAGLAALVGCVVLPLARADARGAAALPTAPEAPVVTYANPVPSGRVTRPYGESVNPFTRAAEFHGGVDLGAPEGTPILAPADAVVELATTHYAPLESAGTVVILDHQDGYKTFYSHLAGAEVTTGARVSQGAAIGRVGSTGRSTGPHLHLEVWKGEEHVDPGTVIPELAASGR